MLLSRKKLIMGLLLLLFTLVPLTSCGDDEEPIVETPETINEKMAYGYVHNHYIGIANVVVANDVVVSVHFDEAFTPYTWAQETTANSITDVVKNADGTDYTTGSGIRYAKYLKIGDQLLTGTLYTDTEKDDLPSGLVVKYANTSISDLYTYLKTEANAKWYVKQIYLGKVYVAKADGNKDTSAKFNPQGTFFKSSSLYWTTGDIGWARNLQFIANGIVGTNMSATPTKNADGKVVIGTLETSATITDYLDYYNLAKKAFSK